MIKKSLNCLLIIISLFAIAPIFSLAQTAGMNGDGLEIVMTPQNPEPLQNITLTLQSYTYDLDRSRITWSVNGVNKKTDTGLKQFTTQAGKNGGKITVEATVITPTDGVKTTEISFTPSMVDLIYESLSYTPPFYQGRALNPNQGVVLVTAIPALTKATGEKISAQNIIYSWKKDGSVEQSDSGLGKNTFIFTGTVPIRNATVEVTASSLDGTITATKQITVTNTSPKIIFYENNPVYGIMYNKAITNTVKMLTDEFSVVAVPYFFSVGYATTPDLDYVWTMNGQTVGNQDPKNSFTTRTDKPGAGTTNIGVKISNNVRIFQFTNADYSINFNKQ